MKIVVARRRRGRRGRNGLFRFLFPRHHQSKKSSFAPVPIRPDVLLLFLFLFPGSRQCVLDMCDTWR